MKESFEDLLNTDARAASCLVSMPTKLLRFGLRGHYSRASKRDSRYGQLTNYYSEYLNSERYTMLDLPARVSMYHWATRPAHPSRQCTQI
jgi:hypothetical protein